MHSKYPLAHLYTWPRYSCNIVESGVKHYNLIHNPIYIYVQYNHDFLDRGLSLTGKLLHQCFLVVKINSSILRSPQWLWPLICSTSNIRVWNKMGTTCGAGTDYLILPLFIHRIITIYRWFALQRQHSSYLILSAIRVLWI